MENDGTKEEEEGSDRNRESKGIYFGGTSRQNETQHSLKMVPC